MPSSRIHRVRSRSAEERLMTASASAPEALRGMCRNEKWAVSIPPSADWAQLHCWSFFDTWRWAAGTVANSSSGRVGASAGGHPVAEAALRRHRRQVDAAALDVELPAVVDAAQPALLVAAEEEARPA